EHPAIGAGQRGEGEHVRLLPHDGVERAPPVVEPRRERGNAQVVAVVEERGAEGQPDIVTLPARDGRELAHAELLRSQGYEGDAHPGPVEDVGWKGTYTTSGAGIGMRYCAR